MKNIHLFCIISSLIFVISITFISLIIYSLVEIKDNENCNDETCISSGCIYRYCSQGTCKEVKNYACCENGNCNSTSNQYNYTYETVYVNEIIPNQQLNTTNITINNDNLLFSEGNIYGGCLISTGDCINEMNSLRVENIYLNYFFGSNNNNNSEYISIGNDYLRIYDDGSFHFLQGFTEIDDINSTLEVCLVDIESLIDNGTIDINNFIFDLSENTTFTITNITINSSLILFDISNQIDLNFGDAIEISNLIVQNNTIKSDLSSTNNTLLINPNGGFVGIGTNSNNISSSLLRFNLDVNGNIETKKLVIKNNNTIYDSNETDIEINFNEKYQFQTNFTGPWIQNSDSLTFYLQRFSDYVQFSFPESYTLACSGNETYIQSIENIPTRFIDTTTTIEGSIRVNDGSSSNSVRGRILIDSTGNIIIGTSNFYSYYQSSTGFCGFQAFSIQWII